MGLRETDLVYESLEFLNPQHLILKFIYLLIHTGKFPEDVMRTMVLVLSHLFGRVYLHANYKRRIHLCPTSKV